MARALALTIGKELRLLWRDRVGLFMLLIAPVVVIAAAGFSLANIYGAPTGTVYTIAIVDEDHGEAARAVGEALAHRPGLTTLAAADRASARTLVLERKVALLAIVIPPRTTRALAQAERANLVLLTDPVRYLQTVRVEVGLAELCRRITAGAAVRVRDKADPLSPIAGSLGLVEAEGRAVDAAAGERGFNAFDLQVPGFAITFLLIGMLIGLALALIDEHDWGTLARLRASAAPLYATLIGKVLARFGVGFAQLVVLFAVGRAAFGISLGAHPIALLAPAAAIAFAAAGFGLIVAAAGRTRDAVLPVGAIVIMTMAAMGGCWWPIDFEPPWMQTLALALPTTWAMRAFNDLMIRGLPASAAALPTAVNLGFGILYAATGAALTRRRFA
jgi:ABC-2 type transport system permease protein